MLLLCIQNRELHEYNLSYSSMIFKCIISTFVVQDRELSEYSPSLSNSSKHVPCSHELCSMGTACKTPNDHCPYTVNYESSDTSSSGFLFEDKLHLASAGGNKVQGHVQATVVIGYACLLGLRCVTTFSFIIYH